MSARDDFPNHGHYTVHEQMLIEIDRLRQKVEWNYHRLAGMERREVTFRSQIEHRENFIRKLMAELRQHGWGDMHYGSQEQDASIRLLLEEGEVYTRQFVIMQEGNVYERGSDQSRTPSEEAGT